MSHRASMTGTSVKRDIGAPPRMMITECALSWQQCIGVTALQAGVARPPRREAIDALRAA